MGELDNGRRRAVLAALVSVSMAALGCERGEDPSRYAGGTVPDPTVLTAPAAASPAPAVGTESAPAVGTESASPSSTAEVVGPGPGDWGTLRGVCGPREGGGDTPAGAGPDEIQGVGERSIAVGTIADPGFAATPGLNQEIFDAADAFVAWCNAAGGINGRLLELTKYDAALTNYQPVVEQACGQEFAIVGDGAVQDNLWPSVGAACGLIDIAGFSVTPEKAGRAGRTPGEQRTVQAVPNPSDQLPVAAQLLLDEAFPGAAEHTGVIWADFQTTIAQADKEIAALELLGHRIVRRDVYNVLGEANWTPFAVSLREAGVRFLRFIGDPENAALHQQALEEIGFRPDVVLQETNMYDQNYLQAGGPAVEGNFVRTIFWPFEEAASNPATQLYLDNLARQGGKVAVLGLQSTSAWLMFATLAKQCDLAGTLSRSCILERAAQLTEWDGGGLHATVDPAANVSPGCVIVLRIEDGKFVRWMPDAGYACPPDSVVDVPGPDG